MWTTKESPLCLVSAFLPNGQNVPDPWIDLHFLWFSIKPCHSYLYTKSLYVHIFHYIGTTLCAWFSLLLLLLLFWTCLSITNFIFPQFVLLHFLSYKTPLFTHQRNNSKSNNNKKLLRSSFVWRVYGCVRSANNICFEDFFVWNFYVLLLIRGYCIEIYTWIYIYTCTYVHTYGWECSFIHHTHT